MGLKHVLKISDKSHLDEAGVVLPPVAYHPYRGVDTTGALITCIYVYEQVNNSPGDYLMIKGGDVVRGNEQHHLYQYGIRNTELINIIRQSIHIHNY